MIIYSCRFWLISDDSGWFRMILVDSGWFRMILDNPGWFWMILNNSGWFWMIFVDSSWFRMILVDFGWFWLILDDVEWCWRIFDDSGWFWMIPDNPGWFLMMPMLGEFALLLAQTAQFPHHPEASVGMHCSSPFPFWPLLRLLMSFVSFRLILRSLQKTTWPRRLKRQTLEGADPWQWVEPGDARSFCQITFCWKISTWAGMSRSCHWHRRSRQTESTGPIMPTSAVCSAPGCGQTSPTGTWTSPWHHLRQQCMQQAGLVGRAARSRKLSFWAPWTTLAAPWAMSLDWRHHYNRTWPPW